jgi:hypothetical protein
MNMRALSIVAAAGALGAVVAQGSFSYAGGVYSENFNTLPNDAQLTLVGTGTPGNQVEVPGLTGWQATRLGGSQTSDTTLWSNSSTGGRLYAYGTGTDADRALGHLGSGSFWGAFGVALVNNSGQSYSALDVSVAAEIWVLQGTSTANLSEHRLSFAYGTSAQGITDSDFLTSASMTPYMGLDAVSVEGNTITGTNSGTDPDRNRDGNSGDWRTVLDETIGGLTWDPGETLYLRWSGENGAGFDAGLAIDDLSVTGVPEPGTLALVLGLAVLLGVVARRRR